MYKTLMMALMGILLLAFGACNQSMDPIAPAQQNQPDVTRTVSYIPDDACGQTTTSLIAGQNMNLGTITVSNNEGYLYFDVVLSDSAIADGWVITETHADVYDSLGGFPQTKKGNPKVGNFAFDIDSEIPLDDLWVAGTTLYVSLHAVLERIVDGVVVQEETGWGDGSEFPGKSWAMYFTHEVGDCCWVDVGLPSTSINAQGYYPWAAENAYWRLYLTNVPSGHDIDNNTNYPGWCVEDGVFMYNGQLMTTWLYSSYDTSLPDHIYYGKDGYVRDWNRINYILNHKKEGAGYTAIQYAIWYFCGFRAYPGAGDAQDMINDANTNGEFFEPGYGDVWAIILDSYYNSARRQLVIIEVNPCE